MSETEEFKKEILREIDRKNLPKTDATTACNSPFRMVDIESLQAFKRFFRRAIDDWEMIQ